MNTHSRFCFFASVFAPSSVSSLESPRKERFLPVASANILRLECASKEYKIAAECLIMQILMVDGEERYFEGNQRITKSSLYAISRKNGITIYLQTESRWKANISRCFFLPLTQYEIWKWREGS